MLQTMRPKKEGEKKTEPITIKATPSLKARIQDIANSENRTVSQTALFLMERGLAEYQKDGHLKPAIDSGKVSEIASVRAPLKSFLKDETKGQNRKKSVG